MIINYDLINNIFLFEILLKLNILKYWYLIILVIIILLVLLVSYCFCL